MGKEREGEEYLPRHPGTAGMEIEIQYVVSKGAAKKNQKFGPERKEWDPKFENSSRMEWHFPVPVRPLSICDVPFQRRVPRVPQCSSKNLPLSPSVS